MEQSEAATLRNASTLADHVASHLSLHRSPWPSKYRHPGSRGRQMTDRIFVNHEKNGENHDKVTINGGV